MRRPPGPPRPSLLEKLGHLRRFATDPLGIIGERFGRYGDIYYLHNDGLGLYVLRHPAHIHEVLATRASSFGKGHSGFDRLGRVLGKQGLLTLDGDEWMRHRRMLGPAFTPRRNRDYAQTVVEEAVAEAERWRGAPEIDVGESMIALTLRVVSRALFSHDVGNQIDQVSRVMTTAQQSPLTLLLPPWVPTLSRVRLDRAVANLDQLIYRIIEGRKTSSRHTDLLQALVDAVDADGDGQRLSRSEVRDEIMTLFLAGHETTSNALTWTFYLLATHPEVEDKLLAELDRVLGGRDPSYDDLGDLVYTRQVIDESMRLRPPVPTIVRQASEDSQIGDYQVPKGSEVAMWIYFSHHDERWFPEPARFRPERWAEPTGDRPKAAYAPFGLGPRACVGRHFALMEAVLMLATLSQRFRLTGAPGEIKPRLRITMSPSRPLRLRPRGRAISAGRAAVGS